MKVTSVNLNSRFFFIPVIEKAPSVPYSIALPQEINRPSLWVVQRDDGEEFLHYSGKPSPEIDKFPAGQDTAPCL